MTKEKGERTTTTKLPDCEYRAECPECPVDICYHPAVDKDLHMEKCEWNLIIEMCPEGWQ